MKILYWQHFQLNFNRKWMKVMLWINICFVFTRSFSNFNSFDCNVLQHTIFPLFDYFFHCFFFLLGFFFVQRQKCSSWMNSSNHWSTSIMKSIRRSNWCALYGMCRCFHPPYIGCTETRCWILIWHAVALGKLFH